MAAPVTGDEFLELVRKSGVADEKRLDTFLGKMRAGLPTDPAKLAVLLIQDGLITNFQAENILAGKWRRFSIGKYKVLEKLGSGGFAQVYLCEHKLMRRRVAVKVLPAGKAKDSSALERFHREARAVAALDHPNIVHAYDIDQDADLHFLVMEYVDGCNLQEIVKIGGPLPVLRACHYIQQAAFALQHAHENGLVHRDIKPGNILVDRSGIVKVLDMGLALFFHDEDDQLTKKHDDGTLGTADYLSPEQAMDSHDVDIRTDIYSLGVTFYFLLTGKAPFEGLPITQKLMAHQLKEPKSIDEVRADVSAELAAIIKKMMAKKATERYAEPGDLAEALEPFTQEAISPPTEAELPKLSPAASGQSEETIAKRTTLSNKEPESSKKGAKQNGTAKAALPVVAATSATAVVQSEPEPTSWEQISTDTDATAQDDTSPLPTRKPAAKNREATPAEQRKRILLATYALVFVGLFFVGIMLAAAVWYFTTQRQIVPARAAPKIEVGKNRPNAELTIQAALKKAEIGAVIELWDEIYEENIQIDPARGRTAVTLQAAQDKQILWRSRSNSPNEPLIKIDKGADFQLKGKGITLDGGMAKKGKVNDLIMITSDCPGLVIDDLECKGFARSAVFIMNAMGLPEKPIKLLRLTAHADTSLKPRAAIYFDANPKVLPHFNDDIHIEDGDFQGFEAAQAVSFKDNSVLGKNVRWPGR